MSPLAPSLACAALLLAPQEVASTQINAAIDRGVAHLLAAQGFDGGWPYGPGPRVGMTALALYTLLKSGVDHEHQAVQRAVAHLEGLHPGQTYDTALLILALAAHDAERHRARIADLADELLAWQHGDWGYPAGADLSNTQYGALGLWAAAKAGVEIPPRAWNDLAIAALGYRAGSGFSYRPGGSATGSMTAAGVGVLAICREQLESSSRRSVRQKSARLDQAIEGGLEWLDRHFSVRENPGVGGGRLGYYLYGLERVGALVPTERIGEHDWYREGAAVLVRGQSAEGHWGHLLGHGHPETCFALLFLRRATHPVTGGLAAGERSWLQDATEAPVRIAAAGDNPIGMWITAFSHATREAYEWPGEEGKGLRVERVVWRVDGTEVARVPGDSQVPAGHERYAHRQRFEHPGSHELEAEVHLLAPPVRSTSGLELPAALRVVRSAPLTVGIENACEEWMLANARDVARNVLPAAAVEVTASSTRDGSDPRLAVDGRQDTSWLADAADERPVLTLRFADPVEADTVVIGHARDWPVRPGRWARALELLVTIDGKEEHRVRMHSDEQRKARLALGRARRIHTLEIAIPWRVPGEGGEQAVGLAEVELQLGR